MGIVGEKQDGVVVRSGSEDLFVRMESEVLDVLGVFHQDGEAFKIRIGLNWEKEGKGSGIEMERKNGLIINHTKGSEKMSAA